MFILCLVAFSSWLFFICVNFLVTLGIGPIYEGGYLGGLMRHTNVVFGYICSYAFLSIRGVGNSVY